MNTEQDNTQDNTQTEQKKEGLGIWHNPTADYGWGLGPWGSIAAIAAAFCVLAAFIPPENKLRNVTVVVIVGALIVGPFAMRDRWGRNLYTRIRSELRWLWHRSTGQNLYESAWFTSSPVTRSQLPGLLSQLSVAEHTSPDGDAFAVLHHPPSDTVSVVIECQPVGADLTEGTVVGRSRRAWASWLDALGGETDLVAVQVVTEAAAAPETATRKAGTRFEQGHNKTAEQLIKELVEDCAGRIQTRTWVSVSWSSAKRTRTTLDTSVLPARVERLCAELTEAGAGTTRALNRKQLTGLWAGMYDPTLRDVLASSDVDLDMKHAGPTVHDEQRERYKLSTCDSVSLTVGESPDALITTAAHDRLSAGVEGATAVRWTQHLRPVTPIEARSWAGGIQKAIDTRLAFGGDRKPKISDVVAEQDTTTTAAALARGTALTRVGFTVTLTLETGADTAGPIERVRNAYAPLTPHLRLMNGCHQTSWVSSLPGALPVPKALTATEGLNQ